MEETNLFNNTDFSLNEESSTNDILNYIMEQIFITLPRTEYALKGGYLLSKILPAASRQTVDIDFSILKKSYYENVKILLNAIGTTLMNNNVISDFKIKDTIEETQSGGIDFHLIKGRAMGIDVGLHSLNYDIIEWNINNKDVNGFSIERMLADKISAIYSRKRFRRPKDLYDFYILTDNFDVKIKTLLDYINKKTELDIKASPLQDFILTEYEKAYSKLIVNSSINAEINKPEFNKIIDRLWIFECSLFNNPQGEWIHNERIIKDI